MQVGSLRHREGPAVAELQRLFAQPCRLPKGSSLIAIVSVQVLQVCPAVKQGFDANVVQYLREQVGESANVSFSLAFAVCFDPFCVSVNA